MNADSASLSHNHAEGDSFAVEADLRTRSLVLYGELDFATTQLLREAADLLDQDIAGPRRRGDLTVQMQGVTFIDAAGINVLMALRRREQAAGRRLALVGASARLSRVFQLAGTECLLATDGVRDHALDAGADDATVGAPRGERRRAPVLGLTTRATLDRVLRDIDHAMRRAERDRPSTRGLAGCRIPSAAARGDASGSDRP
jgi:anti-anti-sigma factor